MSAQPLASATVWTEPDVWAVFDAYEGEFVAAFETQRQAQAHADELERANHDFTYTGSAGYFDRYSLDRVPALDLPAGMEARP